MKSTILFKQHDIPDCETLLSITRYLWFNKIDVRPLNVIERNFPNNIKVLPSILLPNGQLLEGLRAIVEFYEKKFGIDNLAYKSIMFIKQNPKYRITDLSTHKNIKN
jgi:hypothetical protein